MSYLCFAIGNKAVRPSPEKSTFIKESLSEWSLGSVATASDMAFLPSKSKMPSKPKVKSSRFVSCFSEAARFAAVEFEMGLLPIDRVTRDDISKFYSV